ncbi:MAG: beta-galactosidase [Kiritimatiellia bacterium]
MYTRIHGTYCWMTDWLKPWSLGLLGWLAGMMLAAGAAGGVDDRAANTAYDKLPGTVVTPHTAWARPYVGGKLKALVIAPTWTHRETTELAQRMDIQCVPLMTAAFKEFNVDPKRRSSNIEPIRTAEEMKKIALDKLKATYDVYIIGKVSWKVLPSEARSEILKRVEVDGAGLVYVCPCDAQEIEMVFKHKPIVDEQAFVRTGVPLDILPGLKGLPTEFIGLSEFGKGRVVKLDYGSLAWVNVRLSLTPQIKVEECPYAYDYFHSLLAKATLWAARKEPTVFLKKIEVDTKDGMPQAVRLELFNAGQEQTVAMELSVRDGENQIEDTPKQITLALKPGNNKCDLALPTLKDGLHLADIRLMDGDKIINWGSVAVPVISKHRIDKVVLDKSAYHCGEKIQGKVILNQAAEKAKLKVQLWDNFGRLLDEKEMDAVGAETAFTLEIREALSLILKVKAILSGGQAYVISEKAQEFAVAADRDKEKDYTFIMWPSYEPSDYLAPLITRQFYELGVDADFPAGREIALRSRIAARSNLGTVPYMFGTFGAWGSAEACTNNIRKPCLNDPVYREGLKASMTNYAPLLRDLGNPSYCLTIQGALTRSSQEFCFCPICVKGFQEYLKKEYGSLKALNKEWDSKYALWEEIQPVTLAEAKKSGQLARWTDFRVYMEAVFTDLNAFCKREIQAVDPGAIVGFCEPLNASSTRGMSWWKLLSAVDMCGVYVTPLGSHTVIQKEIVRSFLKDGRKGTSSGVWVGSYMIAEHLNRAIPWHNLFNEGDAIWDWYGYDGYGTGGYLALTPDLAPLPYFQTLTSEIKEIKGGIGKLLLNSQRENDGIVIYYSPLTHHAYTLTEGNDPVSCHLGFIKVLEDIGLQYNYISNEQIEQGELVKRGYKALVLPCALAMSAPEVEKIKDFVCQGGLVMADYTPAIMDNHCKALDTSPLAEVFGKFGTELKTQGFGKGKGVYLDKFLADYRALRPSGKEGLLRDAIEKILKEFGIEPKLNIALSSGEKLGAVESVFFSNGSVKYLCLLRDYLVEGPTTQNVTVRLLAKYHIYDTRAGIYLGNMEEAKITLDQGGAKVLALLPYKVTGLDVVLDRRECRPGETLGWQVKVRGSAELFSTHVVRAEWVNPGGKIVPYYAENVLAPQGRYKGKKTLAQNESAGRWTLRLRDVATGAFAEQSFSVKRN